MTTHARPALTLSASCACAAAVALAALTAVAQGAATPGANDVVDRVQAHYQGVSDFRASFVQSVSHKLFPGRLERSYGSVAFARGGLMRWEYARPEKKLFIYDGATLWVYEPEVPQAFKATANADRLRRALAFLSGEGKIRDSYRAEKLDAARYGFSGHVLKLTPLEKASPFARVELYVDAGDYHVVRSVVVDHEGNRNRFDFSDAARNTGAARELFTFTPPEGVPVIDAAE